MEIAATKQKTNHQKLRARFRKGVSMKQLFAGLWFACFLGHAYAAPITPDISGDKPGPVTVESSNASLTIAWSDASNHQWRTAFSLDSTKPLITTILSRRAQYRSACSAILRLHPLESSVAAPATGLISVTLPRESVSVIRIPVSSQLKCRPFTKLFPPVSLPVSY